MKLEIIPKSELIPSFDLDAVAIKYMEHYGEQYNEDEITPDVISKILKELKEAKKETTIYLFLDPDGESDYLEVISDGTWLCLCHCFEYTKTYFSYNPEFANTVEQIEEADFLDENVYAPIDYDGQSPIPKFQAIMDMDTGVRAVEYFIRTGERYPGIDWACCL